MDEKWPAGESWLQPGADLHPHAPAGGSGPGYSIPAVSRFLNGQTALTPGLYSPQACFFEWAAAGNFVAAGDLILRDSEIKRDVEQHSVSIRDAVPDKALRVFFDQQNMLAANACQSIDGDAANSLRKLRIEANWFDYPFSQSTTLHDAEVVLARARSSSQFGAADGSRGLLDDMSQAAVQLRDRTIANIRKAWLDAGRLGKQAELIEIWRRRMRWIDDQIAPGGAEKDGGAASADADAAGSKGKVPTKEKSKKTWVEFQLLDSDGKPVPNEKYLVVLPSGSRETGSLDDHGMVRFDGIDPGQCDVSFSEIDGREWRPL